MVDLAHISTFFGPRHSVGCFSHSNKTTEPDFVIGIGKFQEFWNSSKSVKPLYKYLIFGPFLLNGTVFPLESNSDVLIKKFLRFWNPGITLEFPESIMELLKFGCFQ